MSAVELSAIILTFNRPQRCGEVVKHTAGALQGLPAEIIVVNNGRQNLNLPPVQDGVPCRELAAPTNLGAAARNLGVGAAQGEALLMLDDDAYVDPELPAAILNVFRHYPDVGAIDLDVHDGQKPEACLLPTVFHGCACGLRKTALLRMGGYPSGFVYYGEEYYVAFRLYHTGYRLVRLHGTGKVFHAREQAGRDINRIIYFLIKNNVYLWSACFPWPAVCDAVGDTLRRYRRVAKKEGALLGFQRGKYAVPAAIFKGWRDRWVFPREVYEKATLAGPLKNACEKLRKQGVRKIVVCGTGKFPMLWQRIIRRNGLEIIAYLDRNRCWQGQTIGKTPVYVVGDDWPSLDPDAYILIGLDAAPDNEKWLAQCLTRKTSNPYICIESPIQSFHTGQFLPQAVVETT